jgi:xanthine dehydrogenase accessory factor
MTLVPTDRELFERAAEFAAAGRRFALVTIVRTSGSTPRKAGAKMIVCDDGEILGTVGGGRVEHELAAEARAALESREPRLVQRHLTRELAMCCGGSVEAFIDVPPAQEHLVLVGAGHIHAALAPLGARLGFAVLVVDELEEFASSKRFPDAARIVRDFSPNRWGVALENETFIVIATREHAIDQEVLEGLWAARAKPVYLGVVGSRGKLERFRRRLEAKGVSSDWIARVRGPVGLDIGAESPEEIAVAIAAELVAVRRQARSEASSEQEVRSVVRSVQ